MNPYQWFVSRLRRGLGWEVCNYCGRDVLPGERRAFSGFLGKPCCVHCVVDFAETVRNEQKDVERLLAAKESN